MTTLAPISDEQQHIINLVGGGHSVQVDAVAGSGKTTTSLYIAKENRNKAILQLTYNAKLKLETREKAKQLGLDNIEVHSYHAFCVKYFYPGAFKDSGILRFLKLKNKKPAKPYHFHIVIIDEAQDMNPIYYELVVYALRQLAVQPQIIIMGDRKQSIYAFNKADSRFLTMADRVFGIPDLKQATLSTSYRITKPMAQFINSCCNGALAIQANRPGCLPKYIICDSFDRKPQLEILGFLECGRLPEEFFILGPSIKSERSPIRVLANALTSKGIPIYVPGGDEEKLDEEVLKGKIVFSTFHQVKGLERPIVLVFNFDMGYLEYYAKDIPVRDHGIIPNTLYVAITRAKDILILIHDHTTGYLPFLNQTRLSTYCQMEICSSFFNRSLDKRKPQNTSWCKPTELAVCDLVKYVPVDILAQCMEYISIAVRQPERHGETKKLDIPQKSRQDELYESVSEITGVAIPSYFELVATGKMSILNYVLTNKILEIRNMLHGGKRCLIDDEDTDPEIQKKVASIQSKIREGTADSCSRLLKLATEWVCQKSGFDFKRNQIKDYNWLKPAVLQQALDRLSSLFSEGNYPYLRFEKHIILPHGKYMIIGFLDVYNEASGEIWELKTTTDNDCEHFLQVALYRWLALKAGLQVSASYIYNIYNNKLYTVEASLEDLTKVVDILVAHKENGLKNQCDAEFLDRCQETRAKIV